MKTKSNKRKWKDKERWKIFKDDIKEDIKEKYDEFIVSLKTKKPHPAKKMKMSSKPKRLKAS